MTKNTIYQLQENIVFKGEHVLSELRSLSFEPSVSITEHADQVVVEGTLHLAGEGSYEAGSEILRNLQDPEVQESVVMEDIIYFEHHFPLSISISSARVERKQDVEVYIDHVDYDIPENGRLNVSADIMIEGISEPKREAKQTEEEVRVLPNPLDEWEGLAVPEAFIEGSNETVNSEADISEPKAQDLTAEDAEAVETKLEEINVPVLEDTEEIEEVVEVRADAEAEEQDQKKGEDTFSRFIKSLEEERTMIKIHIAQQDETPETVAERYGVPMLQLMKVNQFESRRPFNRGELIRIPAAQIHSK